MRNRTDLEILFEQGAMIDILEYVECTEEAKKLKEGTKESDSWDIEKLDRGRDEGDTSTDDGWCGRRYATKTGT
jgi:hypothetical protein